MRRALRSVTANRPLWALFAISAVWIAWFATRVHVYFVMPDEARYVKQAIQIWARFRLVVPGDPDFATWSQAEPLLLAPLWGLFQTAKAYQLSHVLNALVLASAVFPAYLLTRNVLGSRGWALVAAALSIVVPWSVFAGVMMTEVAAYPLALWAVYAMQHAATRPSPRADALALLALALAFFGRTQLIVLAPALPIVLLAQGARYPRVAVSARTRRVAGPIRSHPLVFGAVAIVLLIVVVRARALLGNAPINGPFLPNGWWTAREMLAYIAIGVAMLPLALSAAWVAATLARPLSPERHAYAVILLVTGVLLTVLIGGGSVAFTQGINDRYLCYLAPLLMVGMLAFLLERRPLTALVTLAGLGAAWVAWKSRLEEVGPTFVSPSAAWHFVLYGHAPRIGGFFGAYELTSQQLVAWATAVGCLVIGLARRWLPTAMVAAAVAAAVGAYALIETTYTRGKLEAIQPAADYAHGRDWVDRTLPYGSTADILLSGLGDPQSAIAVWWDLTFWNNQVRGMHYLVSSPTSWADQAFPEPFDVDAHTGAVAGLDHARFIVQGIADRRFAFRSQTAVGAPQGNLQVTSLPAPVQAIWAHYGPNETGFVPSGTASTLRVFGDGTAGARTVTVALGPPFGAKRPSPFRIVQGNRVVAAGRIRVGKTTAPVIRLRLPATGHVDLRIGAPRAGTAGLQFYGASIALTPAQ